MLFQKKNKNLENPEKSLSWFDTHYLPDRGIMVNSRKKVSYPEVTGYIVPTLYSWDRKELAHKLIKWLLKEQNDDGSFSSPDGTPYTFDTGQVMRGFVVATDLPEAKEGLRRGCDWILGQVQSDGRLATPSTAMWGNIIDDRIHLYVLPPLIEASEILKDGKYKKAAEKVLDYYKKRKDLIEFNTLSHFHAYIIEALFDLGEKALAQQAMGRIEKLQAEDGSVPAYKDKSFVCSTGLAQFALIWYKIGNRKLADRAMIYLEKMQHDNGGFFGSYGKGANYFPKAEISWATKYFLDAYHYYKKYTQE